MIVNASIRKEINPYTGLVSGQFWSQTGMPWVSSEGRKAVLTEWFWQPIRGQPRRVDTNELRKFSQTLWVYNCVQTIINEIASLEWDIVPRDEYEYAQVEQHIREIKLWFEVPNTNKESLEFLVRAFLKDVLELDAGVFVKVFSKDSYDFEHLEPKSGAPILKPLFCPYCRGQGTSTRTASVQTARKIRNVVTEQLNNPEAEPYYKLFGEQLTICKEINFEMKKAFDQSQFFVECPYCHGTGRGRTLKEVYARDGSSFLREVDKFGFCKGYWQYSYQIPAHPMWFNREEIIYKMSMPRSMSTYGYAPVQAILDIVKSLHYSVQWNRSFYEENAIPDAIVSVQNTSDAELKRFIEYWQKEMVAQPHKLPFVNADVKVQPLTLSQKELEFLESQQWYQKLVISTFQLTPAELGFVEDVNRSTGVTQSEVVRRKAIRPLIKLVEEAMNDVIKEFGFFDVEFRYTAHDIIEESQKTDLAVKELQAGMKTINEIRVDQGLQPVWWGEIPLQLMRYAPMMVQNGGGNAFDTMRNPMPQFPGSQDNQNPPGDSLTAPEAVRAQEADIRQQRTSRDELNTQRQVLMPPQAQMIGAKPQILVDVTTAAPSELGSIKSIKFTCQWCKERYDKMPEDKKCPACGGPLNEQHVKTFFKQVGDSAAVGFGSMSRPQGGEVRVAQTEHPLQDAHPEITDIAFRPPAKGQTQNQYPFAQMGARCPSCGNSNIIFQGIQQADSTYPIETEWYECANCRLWFRMGIPDLLSMPTMANQGRTRGPFYGERGNDRIADFSGIKPQPPISETSEHVAYGIPQATTDAITPEEIASVGQGILPEPHNRKIQPNEEYNSFKETKFSDDQIKEMSTKLGMDNFEFSEIKDGVREELEHTDVTGGDLEATMKIVLAHLKEDPKYYVKLRSAMSKKKIKKVMEPVKQEPETQYLMNVRPDLYEEFKVEERCIFCSSPNIELVAGFTFHCRDCNLEWTDRVNVNPTLRDPRGTNSGQPITEPGNDIYGPQAETRFVPDKLSESQPPMMQTTHVNKNVIKNVIVNDIKQWAGFNYVPFLERILEFLASYNFKEIGDVNDDERKRIGDVLSGAFRSGEQISTISEKINKIVKDKTKAESIARTETIRASNEGKLLEMEDRDVERVKVLVAPDERTCEECKKYDSKTFTLEKAKGIIPIHTNCRCTFIPVIE